MSALLGLQCSDVELIGDAFDMLVQHAVQMLCDAIETGRPASNSSLLLERNKNAAMLNKLPVLCQSLRNTARADTRYTAALFYERTRLGCADSGHFLEGLAPGLPLFAGHTNVNMVDNDLRKLKLRDVVVDRVKTVSSLEELGNQSDRFKSLVRDYTVNDLAAGLPGRVHIFIARMRAVCQGLHRVKPASFFRQCRNCECSRIFYCGAPTESGHAAASAALRANSSLPSPASPSAPSYWDAAGGRAESGHSQSEFCTWMCCNQWKWQIKHALPSMDESELVADTDCRKRGRARVPEALRKIGKRNEKAARHLRSIEKERRRFPALGSNELKNQRSRLVRMLNVDIGLVYASAIVADSRSMSANIVLPAAAEGWRSRPAFYARALKEVGRLYDQHHRSDHVISNMLNRERFLEKLKQSAKSVF